MELKSFRTVEGAGDIDLSADVGTTYKLTDFSTVTIIDPFKEYLEVLKTCFDFDALKKFAKRPEFSLLFDAMHGAGGPFARKIFLEELGMPAVSTFSLNAVCFFIFLGPYIAILGNSPVCCVVTHGQISETATQTPTLLMLQIL